MADLPILRLSPREFLALPEYSSTIPTGMTPGKRWRRLDGVYDRRFIAAGGKPRWMIGEFGDFVGKDRIALNWYRPIIVMKAATGTHHA
jgi:hypothetical protein